MIIPPILKPGDAVGIVSTARKISESELAPLISLLEKWQLQPVLGKSIGAALHQFAGDDQLRTSDLQSMIDNSNIKAIWCARGGYGTVRIIDQLNFESLLLNPKWIIGYSDITVIHNTLHNLGIASLHAQMGLDIDKKTASTVSTVKEAIFNAAFHVNYESDHTYNRTGSYKGKVVGGNLSVLYSLLGSPSAINTENKILFLEDLDEYLYHIDRMMQNIKRNGMLDKLGGLIVGGMSDMNDNTIKYGATAEEIIWEHVKDYDYPVCFNFPAGHIEDNRALILGKDISFNVTRSSVSIN